MTLHQAETARVDCQRPQESFSPSADEYRFGHFVLDISSGELWREGEPSRLRPLAMRALQLLVSNRHRLVTRDELRRHLWGDAALQWQTGLYQLIRQLREVLGADATSGGYITTIPCRGYRWNADEAQQATAPPASIPEPRAPLHQPPTSARWKQAGLYLAGMATLPVVVVIVCVFAGLAQ